MAINELDSDTSFFGDGSSVTFTFDFKVFSEDQIRVVKKDTLTDTFTELTLTTDYAVTLNEGEGGFVLFNVAPLVTDEIYLFRNTDKTQQVELDGDYVNPKQLENALDISRAIDQELDRGLKKAIKLPETSTLEGLEVMDPVFDKYLKWDNQRNIISSDIDYSEILNTPTIPPPAPVDSVAGKTGVVVLNKNDVGLSNVDNTSDLNKPTSTATQTLIDNLNTRIDDLELVDLADVDASGFTQIAVVTYNPVTGKFEAGASGGGGAVDSVNGQIGVVVLDQTDIGLENVDNTSDVDKPVSTAQQTALNLKANTADLGAVATSNSYDDLDDKPLINSYRLENGTTVTRQANDVFVNHTAGTLTSIDLGDPSSVPLGFVFSVASNSFTDSLSVVDNVPNAVFFSNLPTKRTLQGKPVHSWMSTGSSWFQVIAPKNTKIRRETGLTTTRQVDDGLVIFTGVGDVTQVNLGNPAPFDTDDREFSFAVRSLDASFSVVDNSGTVSFDETKIDRKLDIGADTYNVYTYVSEANNWRPFYGAGDGGGLANWATDPFTGDGTETDFTLSQTPGSKQNVFVTVKGVPQDPANYEVSGTTLTFDTAPDNGDKIVARSVTALEIGTPSDGTVSTPKIATGAVTPDKIQDFKFQTKTLSSSVGSDGGITGLGFNGLTVGKSYRLTAQVRFSIASGDAFIGVSFSHGGSSLGLIAQGNRGSATIDVTGNMVSEFVATATTTTCAVSSLSAGSSLAGLSDKGGTYAEIREIPNIVSTTDFT